MQRTGAPTESGFAPLARRGFTTDTVSAIKGMILDGRLRPGDQLPSERALSEALGVSRPTVREAIRSLQAMNIVETRQGSGTFVSSLSVEELLRPLQFALALSDFAMEHLFEVRLMLEPGAAELAAERATDDEIEDLKECAKLGRAGDLDAERLVALDIELHERIATAAHNPLLQRLLASISELAEESRLYTVRLPGVAGKTVSEHDEIVAAIAARDPGRARLAMTEHIARISGAASEHRRRTHVSKA
ncbi:MAG TPA: FadR/GntR family transcriptional regulator [Solirubrobacterales bacterium]|jgi:DNA-binding FadR family transcriptional regulator